MSYFPEDIPYMTKEELEANGIAPFIFDGTNDIELTNKQVIEILNSQRPKPCFKTINKAYDKAIEALKLNQKSKPFTDSEQRIFLLAMEKEKKICKKIDDESDGIINLFGFCLSIERKVMNALWQ